jgi:hypothetical protein
MILGDWEINDIGMIKHLKCREPSASWASTHRCWVDDAFVMVRAPEFVITVASIIYEQRISTDGKAGVLDRFLRVP